MRRFLPLAILGLALTGCFSATSRPTATSTPGTVAQPHSTATPATPNSPSSAHPSPSSTPVVTANYRTFLHTLCSGFSEGKAESITRSLPYYEYNSGLRYGWLGDGEGQTGDPSLATSWLRGNHVRCRSFTPDIAGHGTLLASGWSVQGGWGLLDLDTFGGTWKINDFTFGDRAYLHLAMRAAGPILTYRG